MFVSVAVAGARSGESKRKKKRKGTKRKDFSQKRFTEQAVDCMEKFFAENACTTLPLSPNPRADGHVTNLLLQTLGEMQTRR